ncbi:hypothetical protein [Streptomyces sp. NPDC003480]
MHTDSVERARTRLIAKVISQYPEQLRLEALRETGLYLSGPASLGAFAERLIERSSFMRDRESGRLFRTSVEDTFHTMRDLASTRRLEVITPETGQFLIGDNPAPTLSVEGGRTIYGMAFGDAQTPVLPISPRPEVRQGRSLDRPRRVSTPLMVSHWQRAVVSGRRSGARSQCRRGSRRRHPPW